MSHKAVLAKMLESQLSAELQVTARLKELAELSKEDYEAAHVHADQVLCGLLNMLGFPAVVEEYLKIARYHT